MQGHGSPQSDKDAQTASLDGADFGVELLVGLTKLLLCPSSHGADPADGQGAEYAKGQINEISIANWAEGKNRT